VKKCCTWKKAVSGGETNGVIKWGSGRRLGKVFGR